MAEWHLLYCPKALIKPQYPTPPKKQTTTRNPTTFSDSTFSDSTFSDVTDRGHHVHKKHVRPFRLTTRWDPWWRQPRWHSRSLAFWCPHLSLCSSSTGRPGIPQAPAGSDPDPPHQHMLEVSETEAGEWWEKRGNILVTFKTKRIKSTNKSLERQLVRVVLSVTSGWWPPPPRGWQH